MTEDELEKAEIKALRTVQELIRQALPLLEEAIKLKEDLALEFQRDLEDSRAGLLRIIEEDQRL